MALEIHPDRELLNVGYNGPEPSKQAPLLLAKLAGYFDEAGFADVALSPTTDALAELRTGGLDVAVVDTTEAAAAVADDPRMRVIAGYRNYPGGEYGGDVLLAGPGLVEESPATILAFLTAYIRALDDLSEADGAGVALNLLGTTDTDEGGDPATAWSDELAAFAPWDGGFGSIESEGGLGELAAYLAQDDGPEPPLEDLIGLGALNSAQFWSGFASNPATALGAQPGMVDLRVGLPMPDGLVSPIVTARDEGYFRDAGFASVELVAADEPLLGVLQGQVDLAVMDAVDAADATTQGLPLVVLAGHANYRADGRYGGDVLVASSDVLDQELSTVAAFLIAYVRALRDLQEEPSLAPHDGGFGDVGMGGGLDELRTYLAAETGVEPNLDGLIEPGPLDYAQAHWALPANPTPLREDL